MRRSELVQRLAEVSHETYIRQAVRDKGHSRDEVLAMVGLEPTGHDLERAEDVICELHTLGLLRPLDAD